MSVPAIPASSPEMTREERVGWGKILGATIAVLALAIVWFAPLRLEPKVQHALAITLFMVVLWITEVVPHAITGLIGCWLFWTLEVAPIRTSFGGFNSGEAPWFFLGALLIGAMVSESGLALRISYTILSKVGTTFSNVLLAFLIINFLMTFLLPSGVPRVILLGTIALGAVASFGLDPKSNVARALILAITFSATLNDKTILGSTPAILSRSLIIEHGHVSLYWSQWLIAYAPLGIVNLFAVWWYIKRMYRPEKNELGMGKGLLREQLEAMGPWTGREKRAAFWTLAALALWSTDFLHHVSPAIVGLGVGLAATLPGIGVLRMEDMRKINFFAILFLGTALSMAEVLRETGALRVLSDFMFRSISPWMQGGLTLSSAVLYWTALVAHLVLASEVSMISVTMPLIMDFATNNGLDPLALGLVWSLATGGKLFIYQSLVLIAGYTFGCYNAKDILKIGAFFLILQWLVLLLIVPLYWPILGIG